MPYFGKKSTTTLATCERDLQTVMNEVILHVDCSIVFGHRSVKLQNELYQKGRTDGKVTDLSKVVTYLDGINKKSKHNYSPSKAVDIIPYPGGWQASDFEWGFLLGAVQAVSNRFFIEGKIKQQLELGAFWKTLVDRPHIQL